MSNDVYRTLGNCSVFQSNKLVPEGRRHFYRDAGFRAGLSVWIRPQYQRAEGKSEVFADIFCTMMSSSFETDVCTRCVVFRCSFEGSSLWTQL